MGKKGKGKEKAAQEEPTVDPAFNWADLPGLVEEEDDVWGTTTGDWTADIGGQLPAGATYEGWGTAPAPAPAPAPATKGKQQKKGKKESDNWQNNQNNNAQSYATATPWFQAAADWTQGAAAVDWTKAHPVAHAEQPKSKQGKLSKENKKQREEVEDEEDAIQFTPWNQVDWTQPQPTGGQGKKNKNKKGKSNQENEDPWKGSYFYPPTAAVLPSRTLAYAERGGGRFAYTGHFEVLDSGGQSIQLAQKALFGGHRPSSQRFHWMMPPDHDERVASLLSMLQIPEVASKLTAQGLSNFTETRIPGALVTNADFRLLHDPTQPAFDWFTFEEAMPTCDRTLQQSIIYNDFLTTVVVLVFLVSTTGNSVAVWRRRLPVDAALQRVNRKNVEKIKDEVKTRGYTILVDGPPELYQAFSPYNYVPSLPPQEKEKKTGWFGLGKRR